MKTIKIIFPFFLFMLLIGLLSCSTKKEPQRGEKYGGTFRINASDVPDIIFPGQVLKSSEQLIINQVYVGLLKYNPRNIVIEPSLANNWRVERNQTLYTFYLNNTAYFHEDACFSEHKTRKIVASDVKYSIEQIARFHVLNQHSISSQLKNIQGSEAILDLVMQTDSSHISGIEVINDTTLVFQLKEPDELFQHFLASTNSLVFAHEAFDTYGYKNTVGSGAFTFSYPEIKGHAMILVSNPNFFRKNHQNQQLPFIDTLIVSFITSPPKELYLFEQNNLDLVVSINSEYVIDFLDKHIDKFQSNPPYYIMKQITDSKNNINYNFIRANIQNIDINSIGYFDFSEIYFKEPLSQQIKVN
jgi:ABC-type transport system substrate-binding protein